MAQASVSDKTDQGLSWLKEHEKHTGLSFVLGIPDLVFTAKEETIKVTWKDYTRSPANKDIFDVQRLDEATVSTRDRDLDWYLETKHTPLKQAINATAVTKKILFDLCKEKSIEPKEIHWFIQSEVGKDKGLHIHLVIYSDKIPTGSGKWIQKYLNQKWGLHLLDILGLDPIYKTIFTDQTKFRQKCEDERWVQLLLYRHPQTKKEYVKPVFLGDIVGYYFLRKSPVKATGELGYCYSTDSGFWSNSLSHKVRLTIAEMYKKFKETQKELELSIETGPSPQEKKQKRMASQKEISIKETIDDLVKNRLHTVEKWMLGNPDTYIAQIAAPGGEQIIKNILDIVTLKMSVEYTALDLIINSGKTQKKKAKKTKAWKLIKDNNMNPYKVFHAIMCCLNKQMGKRNTILLCGPASTGKSLIAQKICQLVGNVGCYNASNVNFPFNDCSNKNIIWVEEAGNFGGQVNQFKTIMSGQSIRLDQKGKGSKEIQPTPVIMTTNEDITKVMIGCELKPEHKQPIMDRCVRIELKKRLQGDFGLLEDGEIPDIFKWLIKKGYEPTMQSYCEKWGATPTWGENWNTKPKENTEEEAEQSDQETNNSAPKRSLAEALDPEQKNPEFQELMQAIATQNWEDSQDFMEGVAADASDW
ncbi:nonstructural protein 1 [Megabat bufavirus 1]|uniref:Initiator protein NS1 n=3 Tax=Megabat bufavirus 1 TaxID=1756191 RepID=A0A146GE41_9VIRU|nr:nonstructural protein 1 [Megabat bufavirus 1]BAU69604.1 nonstructural protein 1 [Megabat bufavirus 1]